MVGIFGLLGFTLIIAAGYMIHNALGTLLLGAVILLFSLALADDA